ncbi:hypothetical protein FQJ09_23485 [Escherichia coli]|nr:hypothetical protein [Escherichia coli]
MATLIPSDETSTVPADNMRPALTVDSLDRDVVFDVVSLKTHPISITWQFVPVIQKGLADVGT